MIYRKSVNSDIWRCYRQNARHWPEEKGVYAERTLSSVAVTTTTEASSSNDKPWAVRLGGRSDATASAQIA